MSRIQSAPPSVPSSVTTVVYAPLPEHVPLPASIDYRVSQASSLERVATAEKPTPTTPKPGHAALPLALSSILSTCALAGVGIAAALFPLALLVIVPIAVVALVLVAYNARNVIEDKQAARGPVAKRPFSPTPPETRDMPASMLRGIKQQLDSGAHNAGRALAYLDYLQTPGRFCSDLMLLPLAQARSYKARLWERSDDDEKACTWQSMDLARRFFDTPAADAPTLNLAVGGNHFWTLRLRQGQEPKREDFGGTVLYEMRVQRPEEIDDPSVEKSHAVEIPTPMDGDCLFHAWATAENFEGYNDLDPLDVEGRQIRTATLRRTAVEAGVALVEAGDQGFIKELAEAADEEFNLRWVRGQQELVNAHLAKGDAARVQAGARAAQVHLFEALRLLAEHQVEARAAVLRRLDDCHRLNTWATQALQPQS